jgi:hypothetical protein
MDLWAGFSGFNLYLYIQYSLFMFQFVNPEHPPFHVSISEDRQQIPGLD